MERSKVKKRLKMLSSELFRKHAELAELKKSPASVASQRLISDILDDCLRIHRLMIATVLTAAARKP